MREAERGVEVRHAVVEADFVVIELDTAGNARGGCEVLGARAQIGIGGEQRAAAASGDDLVAVEAQCVGDVAEDVDGDHRADCGAGAFIAADSRLHRRLGFEMRAERDGIEREARLFDVAKMRNGAGIGDGVGGGDEADRRDDHFIASLHAGEYEREVQRRCAVHASNGAASAQALCEEGFEGVDGGADGRDPAGFHRLRDGGDFGWPNLRLVQGNRSALRGNDLTHGGEHVVRRRRRVQTAYSLGR